MILLMQMVYTGLSNGLVLSGIKPLSDLMLTQIYEAVWHLSLNYNKFHISETSSEW